MEWFGAASGFPSVNMRRTDQPCALFSVLRHQTTGVVTKYTSIITIIIIIIGMFKRGIYCWRLSDSKFLHIPMAYL